MTLIVDVISDVICPWCFVGKRRLEKAVVALGQQVVVRWHAFQLNPTMPKAGISRREYRIRKFGSWERSMQLDASIVAVGQEEGIRFDFDRIERTPNTLDAHRMIWLAGKEGLQNDVVEALFEAYFEEGRDIGHHQTLIDVVVGAGLDREKAEAVLNSNDGIEVIDEATKMSVQHHVTGVPFFIISNGNSASGAESVESFVESLRMPTTSSESTKLLFVCSKNKWRSLTAERVLNGVDGYDVKSAGTEKDARIKVTLGHVGWADKIFVMEKKHMRRLEEKFGDSLAGKDVVCLNIPDDYTLMDPALVDLLLEKLRPYIAIPN